MSIIIRENIPEHMRELKAWLAQTADKPLEEMAAFFAARLGGYEEHMACWAKAYEALAQMLAPDCRRILDLGCGTGLELDKIFARFPQMEVTGVDLSAAMLAELRRKHEKKRLSLLCADYFTADLGAAAFDAAISVESLHHFTAEKKRGLFEKIRRSLRPGGVFIECDYIACCEEEEALTFAEARRRRARDGIAEDVFIHFDTPLTLEHECAAMKAAGFCTVEAPLSINGATFIVARP